MQRSGYRSHSRSYSDSPFWLSDASSLQNVTGHRPLHSIQEPLGTNRDAGKKTNSEFKYLGEYERLGQSISQRVKTPEYELLDSTNREIGSFSRSSGDIPPKGTQMTANTLEDKLYLKTSLPDTTLLSSYVQLDTKAKGRADQIQPFRGAETENYGPALITDSECRYPPYSMTPMGAQDDSQVDMMYHPFLYGVNNTTPMMTPPNRMLYFGVQHGRSKSDISRTAFCTNHKAGHSGYLPNSAEDILRQSEACCFMDNMMTDYISPAAQLPAGEEQQVPENPQDSDSNPHQELPPRVICNRRVTRQSLHKYTICSNCGTEKTSLWRRSSSGEPLCNACGLFRKLHGSSRPISLKTDIIRKRNRSRGGVIRSRTQQNAGNRLKNRVAGIRSNFASRNDSQLLELPTPPDSSSENQEVQTQDESQKKCETQNSGEHCRYDYKQSRDLVVDRDDSHTYSDQAHNPNHRETQTSPQKIKNSLHTDYRARQKSSQSHNADHVELRRFSLDSYNLAKNNNPSGVAQHWNIPPFNPQHYDNPNSILPPRGPQDFGSAVFTQGAQEFQEDAGYMRLNVNTPPPPVASSNIFSGYFVPRDQRWRITLLSNASDAHMLPIDFSQIRNGPANSPLRGYPREGLHRRSMSNDVVTRLNSSAVSSAIPGIYNAVDVKNYYSGVSSLFDSKNKLPVTSSDKPVLPPSPAPQKEYSTTPGNCASFDVYGHYCDNFRTVEQRAGATGTDIHNIAAQSHLTIQ